MRTNLLHLSSTKQEINSLKESLLLWRFFVNETNKKLTVWWFLETPNGFKFQNLKFDFARP